MIYLKSLGLPIFNGDTILSVGASRTTERAL